MFKTKQDRINKLKEYLGLALTALLFDGFIILMLILHNMQ